MSTTAAPALETSGGSSTSGSSANTTTPTNTSAPIDPVEALDLGSVVEETDFPIPESMILGGKRAEAEVDGAEETGEAGRNADGTFAKKEAKDANGAKAGEVDPAAAAALATQTSPFRYRAMGQTHEIEGATMDAAGNVTIPAAKMGELRDAFNARHVMNGEVRPLLDRERQKATQLESRVKELTDSRTMADTKADQLVSTLTGIMNEPDDQKALDQIWALRSAWPQLVAKAEATYWEGEAKRGRTAPPETAETERPATGTTAPSQPGMPSPDDAKAATKEYIEHLKLDPNLRGVADEDWQQFVADADTKPFAYLRLATAEHAAKHQGVRVGQVVFDTDLLTTAIQQHATRRATERETATQQRKLAADTARRTQPTIDAPPTPGGGSPRPTKGRGSGITSKQSFEAWLDSDEI